MSNNTKTGTDLTFWHELCYKGYKLIQFGAIMSFKNLSLIFITLLLSSVLLIQWWLFSSFTNDVSRQIGTSAFEVSRATAETLILDQPKVEFHSIKYATSQQNLTQKTSERVISYVRQDVTIELFDEQTDNIIQLNADGENYEIPIPRTGIDEVLESFSKKALYSTITLLLVGITLAIYFTNKIASPLKKLQIASTQLGEGNLGTQISKGRQWHSREINTTINSFNQMSIRIKKLQQQNEKLQNNAHLAELAEVARALAHTIRNPLNTLNLAIDQIEACDDTKQQKKLSTLAKNQVLRIDQWVNSLMNVISSDTTLAKQVNLISIIHAVIYDLKLSTSHELDIIFDNQIKHLPTDEKAHINNASLIAIDSELKGLLQGIIANAVEASPNDKPISIRLIRLNQGYEVTVIDHGKGFSEKILKKLFSPHNTDKTYGAGMGLYLAQRIIKHKYNGDIQVKNNADKGSRVTLILNNREH